MKPIIFPLPDILLLCLSVSILFLTTFLVNRIDKETSVQNFKNGYYFYLAGVAFFCFLAITGFFQSTDSFPPRFPLIFIFNFIFFFVILFQNINKSLYFLKTVPLQWFIYFQAFRIILEIVVLMFYHEKIVPVEITLEGRSFDLIIGISALPIGYLLTQKKALLAGIIFNISGFISIVNIVSIAILSFPSPFQVYDTNFLPAYFPGIFIPLFLAPLALNIHLLSLKQLLHFKKIST